MTADLSSDPALWGAASFAGAADFSIALTDADRREILDAPAVRAYDAARPIADLGPADFGFGALAGKLADAYEAVRDGRGFVLLRGLPCDGLSVDQYAAAVWGIGLAFGSALSQNAQGERISYVEDATAEDATPR